MPFRNARRFLAAAIESILAQDYRDLELLAVDDGSDDDSADIVRASAAGDPRVRLIDGGRRGLPGALNEGCGRARGQYLARMDADDIALPSRLSRQVAALDASADLVVVGGAVDLIDERDRIVGEIWYAGTDVEARAVLALGSTPFCHPAATIRRTAFEAAGRYRGECELAEDMDLWLRLAPLGRFQNLDEKVLRYRLHPSSSSHDRVVTQIRSLHRALIANDRSRDSQARAGALATEDPWTLVEQWASAGGAAVQLGQSSAWYVELAVTAGYDEHIGALIDAISGIAPPTEQATVAGMLWTAATAAAIAAGRPTAAAAHLARGRSMLAAAGRLEIDREALGALEGAINARLDIVVTAETPPVPRDGGYLDSVHWFDRGTRAFLHGWIARPRASAETTLRLHLASPDAAHVSVERVLRHDVGRAMGPGQVISGFRVDLRFPAPVPDEETTVRASVSYADGTTASLEDANLLVRRPEGRQPVPL